MLEDVRISIEFLLLTAEEGLGRVMACQHLLMVFGIPLLFLELGFQVGLLLQVSNCLIGGETFVYHAFLVFSPMSDVLDLMLDV